MLPRIDRLSILVLIFISALGCGKATENANVVIDGSTDVRLALTLHLDRIAAQAEQVNKTIRPQDAVWLEWRKRVGLDVTHLYVLQEGADDVEPVAIIPDEKQKIWNELSTNKLFSLYLHKRDDGSLELNPDALPTVGHLAPRGESPTDKVPDSVRELRIKWHDGRVFIASIDRIQQLESGTWDIGNAITSQLIERVDLPNGFFSLAAILPKDSEFDLEKELNDSNVAKQIPGMGRMTRVLTSCFESIRETLKTTDAVALSVSFPNSDQRCIRYAQLFRNEEAAAKVHAKLTSTTDQSNASGLATSVALLLQDEQIKEKVRQSNRLVEIEAAWSEKADKKIGSFAQSVFMRFTMAQSLGGDIEPSTGPIQTRYAAKPRFISLSAKKLRAVVENHLHSQIFPSWAHDQGDAPSMHAELDTMSLPNVLLSEGSYKVLSVTAAKKEVLRKDDRPDHARTLQLAHTSNQYLEIPFRKGTLKKDLQTARIQFTLNIPRQVDIAKFAASDAPGTKRKAGERQVEITKIARDVASVRYPSDANVRLFAFDKTGGVLSSLESMQGGGSAMSRFAGEVDKLWIALSGAPEQLVVTVNTKLNGGEQLKLPDDPKPTVQVRFDAAPMETFQSLHEKDLNELRANLGSTEGSGNQERLFVQLPDSSPGIKVDWELYWFAIDQPISLNGFSYAQNAELVWRPQDGLGKATAVTGLAMITMPTDFNKLSFSKSRKQTSFTQQAGDQTVELQFNHNHITYSPSSLKVMALYAFDADGRRLKTDHGGSQNDGSTSIPVWGQPQRVEIIVSGRTIEKKLNIDIARDGTNEAAFDKFKRSVSRYHQVLLALIRIQKAMNKGPYGYDELAGLQYLHNRQGKAMDLIPIELAHACPQGAKRFGFEPKPYAGYYFNRLPFAGQSAPPKARTKKFRWSQGELEIAAPGQGTVVAVPVNEKDPTLVAQWGSAYMKFLNGQDLPQIPRQLQSDGWAGVTPVQDQHTTRLIQNTH